MKPYLYGYNQHSQSLKALSQTLLARRIKTQGSKFRPKPTRAVINWGSSQCPYNPATLGKLFNLPTAVAINANKLTSFQHLSAACRMPDWSVDKEEAYAWQMDGHAVMARKVLTGHSGEGIVYCGGEDEIPDAPLYTLYVPKAEEYRVHLFRSTASFFVQRKARKKDVEKPNWRIRNLPNGFIYATDPATVGTLPADVLLQARAAFEHSGLDFGAIDVVWNQKKGEAYILEINTAPGLTGHTLEFYTNSFKEVL